MSIPTFGTVTEENVGDYLRLETDTKDFIKHEKPFLSLCIASAKSYIKDYTARTDNELCLYPSSVIILYLLCSDMYEKRSYTLEKNAFINPLAKELLDKIDMNFFGGYGDE